MFRIGSRETEIKLVVTKIWREREKECDCLMNRRLLLGIMKMDNYAFLLGRSAQVIHQGYIVVLKSHWMLFKTLNMIHKGLVPNSK